MSCIFNEQRKCANKIVHVSSNFRSIGGITILFEPMDTFGIPVSNEYDCPLLSLNCFFRCVFAHCVLQSVSIVHECTSTCMVKNVTSSCIIECLSVSSQKQLFVHNYNNTNNIYALNIYCMHFSE